MKKKRIFKVVILALVVLSFTKATPTQARDTYAIEIHSFLPGTTTYVMGVALADQINKHSTWLKASHISGKGFVVSGKMLVVDPSTRKTTIHQGGAHNPYQLAHGQLAGPLTGVKYDGLRIIALGIGIASNGFVALDPKYKHIIDLNGKKVAGHVARTVNDDFEAMFKAYGVNIELERIGYAEGQAALRNRLVSAALMPSFFKELPDKWTPNPAFDELIRGGNVQWLTWEKEKYFEGQKLLGVTPEGLSQTVEPVTIKEGTLAPDQTPWPVLPAPLLWYADVEMPDDVVYEICRVIYENADAFQEYHVSGRFISKDTMSKFIKPEFIHPGARKFYDEHGLTLGPVAGMKWASYAD